MPCSSRALRWPWQPEHPFHVRHPAGPPTEATGSRPVLVAAASPDFVQQSFSEGRITSKAAQSEQPVLAASKRLWCFYAVSGGQFIELERLVGAR
jgi:hypothetical protein